jgi:hypothetical protein
MELTNAAIENPAELAAMRYLEDQAYTAMLVYQEPVRTAEIIGVIGKEGYTAKLLRHVLAASPRFAQIDRRWDLDIRYEDLQRPLERVLREIVDAYGKPISIEEIAINLSSVYDKPADYYEEMLPRMLADTEKFFKTLDNRFGLASWLLSVMSDDEEDILFDSGMEQGDVEALESSASKVAWTADFASAVAKLADTAGVPVSGKVASLFRWRALPESFDAVEAFNALYASKKLTWLSDGRWISEKMAAGFDSMLTAMADRLADEIMEESPVATIEKAEVAEDVAPTLSLTISEQDLDEVVQIVSGKGVERMPVILESIFEISPRDPVYEVAAEGLSDAMRADSRFAWVGGDRWRMAETLPAYINQVPAELEIKPLDFETPEGEKLDVELDDEGLEGGLAAEIHNPLVQDVHDCDQVTEQDKLPAQESARCVLFRHHKKLGTFPLCQISDTFFPIGPKAVEIILTDGGSRESVWINRETGLIMGMDKWYTDEMPESGAVFELVKTEKPEEYKFVYDNTTDPLVFVSPGRVEALAAMADDPKTQNMTTFELMSELMQDHKKGVSFVTLFTEVNIVRRSTRRLVASILSSYYPFYQRGKSALWQFDEKKVDQGFKKAKRKYIRK